MRDLLVAAFPGDEADLLDGPIRRGRRVFWCLSAKEGPPSVDALTAALRRLRAHEGPFTRVFTHGLNDTASGRREVSFAVHEAFARPFSRARQLLPGVPRGRWMRVDRRLARRVYCRLADDYRRASRYGFNAWSLGSSPYERERHARTDSLLEGVEAGSVLELGACEGRFSRALKRRFPDARFRFVEPHPAFAARFPYRSELRAVARGRFDLVVAMQLLHYVPEPRAFLRDCARLAGRWLLFSQERGFDFRGAAALFRRAGLRPARCILVPPRLESLGPFPDPRPGERVELWRR